MNTNTGGSSDGTAGGSVPGGSTPGGAAQCPAGFSACGNLCFNPQIQNCQNGNVVSIGQPGTVNTNAGGDASRPLRRRRWRL